MNLAPRAALLAGLMGVAGVLLSVLVSGFSLLAGAALVGAGLLAAGVFHGHGPLTTLGLAVVATATALATDRGLPGTVAVIAIGLGASATLVVADASWWLRRDPQVDPAVVRGLLRTLGPVWALGAVAGVGAALTARFDGISIWLLPVGVALTGLLVAGVAWATRGRHPRRDPLTDIRR